MLSVTLTRYPVSTLTPAPAVGTAWTFGKNYEKTIHITHCATRINVLVRLRYYGNQRYR
jgi:hypothetical protein